MSIVYKYCNAHGIDILRNLHLKVTPPNQFNDPFEFTPRMTSSDPRGFAKRILKNKDNLRTIYRHFSQAGHFTGNFREFRRQSVRDRDKMIKGLETCVPAAVESVQKSHLDRISQTYGVLCLSKRPDSILMWGHYCEKQEGIVIGFDSTSPIFDKEKGLREVQYVKERVFFDANWKPASVELSRYEDQIIFSKNKDWAYEEELRQFFILSQMDKKPLRYGSSGYFLSFPPEALVRVILGTRCSMQLASEISSILKNGPLSHARIGRAVLHETDFALRIE